MFVSILRSSPATVAGRLLAVWLVVLAALQLLVPGARAQSSANDGFDPRPDSIVNAMAVQPDGRLLIGGQFTRFMPNNATTATGRLNFARVNIDGTIDSSFAPPIDDTVSAIAIQPDGKIVIATFTRPVNSSNATGKVIRLFADGGIDPTFQASIGGDVYTATRIQTLSVQSDGKIIAGGFFTTIRPNGLAEGAASLPRRNLVRFNTDGSIDSTFKVEADNVVMATLVQPDGNILVGGGFTSLIINGTSTASSRLARLSPTGVLETTYLPAPNDRVTALTIGLEGKLYVGGSFTKIGGSADNVLARLARLNSDGTYDTTYTPYVNGEVATLAVEADGRLLAGGSFTSASETSSGLANPVSHVGRFRTDGSLDTTFLGGTDDDVGAITVLSDGRIVIGGRFTFVLAAGLQSYGRTALARLQQNGLPDVTFEPNYGASYFNVIAQGTNSLIVYGAFNSIAGTSHGNIARIKNTTGEIGVVDTTFNANVNGRVDAAVVQADGKIVIGGVFSQVNGVNRTYLARLNSDGSLDTSYDPNPGGAVTALALQSDGKLLIGGEFLTFGTTTTTSRYYLARLAADGTVDSTFDPHPNSSISQFLVQSDGAIIIIGAFTSIQPGATGTVFSRTYIARLKSDGKLDEDFAVFTDQPIRAAALQSDGKILLGGGFTQIIPSGAKTAVQRYNFVRLDTKGAIDTSFLSEVDSVVYAIAVQSDNKILVGGAFVRARKDSTTVVPDPADSTKTITGPWTGRGRLVRFNTDGTIDSTYEPVANNLVSRIVPHSTGAIVLGSFSTLADSAGASPVYTPVVGRITADGKVDTSFVFASTGASGSVRAIAQLLDGRMLLGGSFTNLAGGPGAGLIRLRTNGTADTTFGPSPTVTTAGAAVDIRSIVVLPPREVDAAFSRPFAFVGTNGQLFPGFGANSSLGMTGTVYAVHVQSDGKLVIGGNFQLNGSSTLKNLVRFNRDGSLDTAFIPEPNNAVHLIKSAGGTDGKLWIGGEFTNFGDTSTTDAEKSFFVRLNADGTVDGTVKIRANSDVRALAIQSNGKIVIGGLFTSIQAGVTAPTSATARTYIARINTDGTLDADFNPTSNAAVYTLGLSGTQILVGGAFTTFQPNGATSSTARQYLARLNENGTLDANWDPKPNALVNSLAIQSDGKVVVGGGFTTFEPKPATGTAVIVSRQLLARINTDGLVDSAYNPAPDGFIYSVAVGESDSLLVGGVFSHIGGVVRNRIAKLTSAGAVDSTFNPNTNGGVNTVTFARVDSTDGVLFGGSFDLVQPFGTVLVGGEFESVGGGSAKNLVRLNSDGNFDSTFLPQPDKKVNAIVRLADGTVIVGGAFTNIGGTARNRLARFNAAGVLDASFNPGVTGDANATVTSLAVRADGKIVVGGLFTTVAGAARANLAQLNTDGTIDGSFSTQTNGIVNSVAVRPDGKIVVGGEFTTLGGSSRANAGVVGADGSLDSAFNPALDGAVNAIVVRADSGFYVGGKFTKSGSTTRNRVARFDAAGALDASFNPGADAEVTALAIASDGKLVIGGSFTTVGGVRRNLVGRVSVSELATNRVNFNPSGGVVTWLINGALPSPNAVYFEYSTDDRTWISLGNASRSVGSPTWQLSGASLPSTSIVLLRARGTVINGASSASFLEGRGSYVAGVMPQLKAPTALVGGSGSSFSFLPVTGSTYGATFSATGLPPGLSIDVNSGLISGTPTTAGSWTIVVTATKGGTTSSVSYTITVFAPGVGLRLSALSVRSALINNTSTVTAGFSIGGSGSKPVLLRAAGPALGAYGVASFATRPQLALQTLSGTPLLSNNGWADNPTLSALFGQVGAFPFAAGSKDSAANTTLGSGQYTMTGSSFIGETGVALFEVYDASTTLLTDSASFRSLAVRGSVGTGENILIAGVTVSGAPSTTKRLLVRGIGPRLADYGVTGVLVDPTLSVYTSGGALLASNDNWESRATGGGVAMTASEVATLSTTLGAFTLNAGSKDAVVVIDLPVGVYTMQIKGVSDTTGNALVEIYDATP